MDFNSLETGKPFTHCCDCNRPFTEIDDTYLVQKSYNGTECIFEYAICESCRETISEEFSEKSREAMFDFFHDNADLRNDFPLLSTDAPLEDHIQKCITCSTPRAECKSFSYAGVFLNESLLIGPFPLLFCGTCEENLSKSLSKETQDTWNRFIEENFPGPPADARPTPTHGKPILF